MDKHKEKVNVLWIWVQTMEEKLGTFCSHPLWQKSLPWPQDRVIFLESTKKSWKRKRKMTPCNIIWGARNGKNTPHTLFDVAYTIMSIIGAEFEEVSLYWNVLKQMTNVLKQMTNVFLLYWTQRFEKAIKRMCIQVYPSLVLSLRKFPYTEMYWNKWLMYWYLAFKWCPGNILIVLHKI